MRRYITILMVLLLGGTSIVHAQCVSYSLGYAVYSSESFGNIQVGAGGPVPGHGSVVISGDEQSTQVCHRWLAGGDCQQWITTYDSGTVSITVNGFTVSVNYGSTSTASSLATALASALNGTTGSPVTASINGSTDVLTARTTGAGTNYTLSATSSTNYLSTYGGPSFSPSPSGSVLAGGSARSDLVHVLTSVLVDGSASMTVTQSSTCPYPLYENTLNELPTATHTPSAYNVVNGVGGWGNGTSECVTCYLSTQTNGDSGPVNYGVNVAFTSGGQVDCSVGGIIWEPIIIGNVPVCVIPTTEETAVHGTEATTYTQFVQTIFDTAGDNFNGQTVVEGNAAPGQDTCWGTWSIGPRVTGVPTNPASSWTVDGGDVSGQPNAWGFDVVGWSKTAVDYYRVQDPAHNVHMPCGFTVYQSVTISCPTGLAATYTPSFGNKLTATIGQSDLLNCRYDMDNSACQTIPY